MASSQEEAQTNIQIIIDITKSLGWILNQGSSELKTTQWFLFVSYKYHLDSALVKPTQKRLLKLQDFILCLKSKHVLTARCLMLLFQFHLEEHWRYPKLLDSLLPWSDTISVHLGWWQNPISLMRCADLQPKVHNIQIFTDTSNEGWAYHSEQVSTKGLWSDREKAIHKCSRVKGGISCYGNM